MFDYFSEFAIFEKPIIGDFMAIPFSHNVIDILKSFSKKEILSFKLFLGSPFFNKQKQISGLFEKIIRFYPRFNSNIFTEDFLLVYISPNNNKLTLYSALSVLLEKIREFLSIQNLRRNNVSMDNALLNELKMRGLNKLFEKNLSLAFDNISGANLTSQDEYFFRYQFENIHLDFLTSSENLTKLSKLNKDANVRDSLLTNLVSSFALSLTPLYLDYLFLSFNYSPDFKTSPAYKLLSAVDVKGLMNELKNFEDRKYVFEIYTAMLDMYSDLKSSAKYKAYKKLVEENADKMKSYELSFHYSCLIHFSTMKIEKNPKNKSVVNELAVLYEIYLENKLYRDGSTDYLSEKIFRNIFLFYVVNKMSGKAKLFIDEYIGALKEDDRVNMENYSLAYYHYSNAKFKESLKYLKHVETNYFFLKYDVRNLYLRNYYELGYTENSLASIDAYRHFLAEEKTIRKSARDEYKVFIDYYEKLVHFSTGKNMKDLGYFKKNVDENVSLYSRNWMLRKIEELEGAQKQIFTKRVYT